MVLSESDYRYAFTLDGEHVDQVGWDQIDAWSQDDPTGIWVHLDRTTTQSQHWLREQSGLGPEIVEALLASGTRPRLEAHEGGILLTLRGVNLNEGADPSDMVSLRIWVQPGRLISLERERLYSVAAIAELLEKDQGPKSVGGLLVAILARLTDKMSPVIDGVNERLDIIEDEQIDTGRVVDRAELTGLRQQVVMLHRHLKPQLQVLHDLRDLDHDLLDVTQAHALNEAINRLTRYVEDLETAKNRAGIIQDELTNQFAERMNSRMYAVTIVATMLLPMSIITGLLGINVGGMPGATDPNAFYIVCALLVGIGVGGFAIARKFDWL